MIQEKGRLNVKNKKATISYVLPTFSGLRLVTDISLLVYEGSSEKDVKYEEIVVNN